MERSDHQAFYRPTTPFNRLLNISLSRYGPLHKLNESTVRRWKDCSLGIFKNLVDNEAALRLVVEDTFWDLSNGTPPENTWFGEAKFKGRERPQIIIYRDSITTRLPTNLLFQLAGQSGTDHIFGHLYPFYAGQDDCGEDVACRYQFLAAREREGVIWNSVSGLAAVLYKLHKNIPLSNYRKVLPLK